MTKIRPQKDPNGCGIACLANLLNRDYDEVKTDFENRFYTIDKGIKMFDIVKYLNKKSLNYKSKFFNQNKKYKLNVEEADCYSRIPGSITLIKKNEKYPIGHYLLKVQGGWIDPWYNLPDRDIEAGIRRKLPGNPWYVLYPN